MRQEKGLVKADIDLETFALRVEHLMWLVTTRVRYFKLEVNREPRSPSLFINSEHSEN